MAEVGGARYSPSGKITFRRALGRDYYVDADAMRAAVKNADSFNAVHFASAIKLACFVAGDNPFEAEQLATRQRVEVPGGALYVDTAEHTLLANARCACDDVTARSRSWR